MTFDDVIKFIDEVDLADIEDDDIVFIVLYLRLIHHKKFLKRMEKLFNFVAKGVNNGNT